MKTKKINRILLCILTAFLALFFVFESALSIKTKADEASEETVTYSDVLDDLKKDETFDETQYPEKADDYSLQVIQLAESTDGELLVYVYQPCNPTLKLEVTTIRLAVARTGIDSTWKDYPLALLSENGVLCKYAVLGLTVDVNVVVRQYDVTAIHRKFIEGTDSPSDENWEQTINEMVYPVGMNWAIYTLNGENYIECEKSDYIEITDKVVGYIRYPNGYGLSSTSCDAHFVAFSTDLQIDELYEADVEYDWISYSSTYAVGADSEKEEISRKEDEIACLNVESTGENTGDGWFGKKYTWERITTAEEFISKATNEEKDINLTNAIMSDLQKKQWVLNFVDTEYVNSPFANNYKAWTEVSGVSILRLKFKSGVDTYNLGVVDNKQTGSKEPAGGADTKLDDFIESTKDILLKALKIILIVVVAGILLSVLLPILPKIFGVVFAVFKWIIKALWWIIAFPFNLLGKRKKKQDSAPDGRSNAPPCPQNPEKQKKK